ncbi:type II secretion system F family protein [Notoacmeibacter sp. MSK16QG-6]|uniref:type II secretion system F family protein n=1 Tax=Notoacmeibacter sp. MSK16QG-6 TaxID=2957982 RepID=UPI00209EBF1B|nr:type II secretion system F family protein [Notoacmeibacter sp. MSK16QG-6]MCP1198763.1 type II secretion system F family protein [Notoacmeibacter sp. MSK16QG-6]
MFGLSLNLIALIALVGLSAGGVAYALLFGRIEKEKKADRRFDRVRRQETDQSIVRARRDKVSDAARRRKSIQETLSQLDEKNKAKGVGNKKKPPLKQMMKQAGITTSLMTMHVVSVTIGIVLAGLIYLFQIMPTFLLPGVLLAAGLGLPRWYVSWQRNRRIRQFLDRFADALEVIGRGVRSGLPLPDCVHLIAAEAPEPVRGEFRRVIERMNVGLSLPEAIAKMPETMPCPEANFFGIVIQIQAQAGGNLSEAIGNLATVLRDRKKMKAKVKALSMEAKASAYIIGSLPIIVAGLIFVISPGYIMPLFTDPTGHIALAVAAVLMAMGIFVMKKMMNFEV